MRVGCVLLIGVLSSFLVGAAHAQDPGKQVDPTPLEHPLPITAVRASYPDQTITQIRSVLDASGFRVTRVDMTKLSVDAQRPDSHGSKDYDRVIVWLERSLAAPTGLYDLYLAYGRFEDMWGRGVTRVRVGESFIETRVAPLRTRLLALGS
jgi:hypothetical protein